MITSEKYKECTWPEFIYKDRFRGDICVKAELFINNFGDKLKLREMKCLKQDGAIFMASIENFETNATLIISK